VERSFRSQVQSLRLGAGEVFHGEGILAVTKALLQSGVSYVSGYPGAPISHLLDVLSDASDILDELGVHFKAAGNEAGAAAMLGASINYPLRGAATWKSVVGTNVASDALSNLSSAGVVGGALIIVGEDYGEGASIIQERSHAFAMKSQVWLLDPRPSLTKIVEMVEHGFALSEASRTPVMLELRIRACHVHGSFVCKDNVAPRHSREHPLEEALFDFAKVCLPPSTYAQERDKISCRRPAALRYVEEHKLNECFEGSMSEVGIICQGGLYNGTIRALQQLGLADSFGHSEVPLHVLNVTYPLLPEEIFDFCVGRRAVLIVEEGQPEYLEQAVRAILQEHGATAPLVHGKGLLPAAGEYSGEVILRGLSEFLQRSAATVDRRWRAASEAITQVKARAAEALGAAVPARPPGFCVGCPERPVLSAIKIAEQEIGRTHVTADVGCHIFSTLPPFNLGSTMLGYGLGLSSAAGVAPSFSKRVISIMGDGGFWHNGLSTGVTDALANQDDAILIIMKNGYAAATGGQHIPSTPNRKGHKGRGPRIDEVLRGLGVTWLRTIRSYDVARVKRALIEASRGAERGLKVIIADGECQLARQRRIRPILARQVSEGRRVVRERFGVDPDVCTGDHSCIRLSGCPSLTIAPNPDPLRRDPIAKVDNSCVGCGLCGEVAHAAVLCPSFFRAEVVQNPSPRDRLLAWLRRRAITLLTPRRPALSALRGG